MKPKKYFKLDDVEIDYKSAFLFFLMCTIFISVCWSISDFENKQNQNTIAISSEIGFNDGNNQYNFPEDFIKREIYFMNQTCYTTKDALYYLCSQLNIDKKIVITVYPIEYYK